MAITEAIKLQLIRQITSLNNAAILTQLECVEKPQQKLSEKYRGIISKEEGQDLNNRIKEMRNEY